VAFIVENQGFGMKGSGFRVQDLYTTGSAAALAAATALNAHPTAVFKS
jgi:hypothetical protein